MEAANQNVDIYTVEQVKKQFVSSMPKKESFFLLRLYWTFLAMEYMG